MVLFDLYARADGLSRRAPGDIVELDGIDGFFDQYFAGLKTGDSIQFVHLGFPFQRPTDLHALLKLPFFRAEVVENHYDWARARLIQISTLGDWSLLQNEPPSPVSEVRFPVQMPTDVTALIRQAQTSGSACWHSGAQYWRSLSEVTAIGALAGVDSTGLWVLTTYAARSYYTRVTLDDFRPV